MKFSLHSWVKNLLLFAILWATTLFVASSVSNLSINNGVELPLEMSEILFDLSPALFGPPLLGFFLSLGMSASAARLSFSL